MPADKLPMVVIFSKDGSFKPRSLETNTGKRSKVVKVSVQSCKLRLTKILLFINRVVVWRGIHSKSDTNRTGVEGLSFYYPRLLYFPNQMLAMMLLTQHRVSSSKTVRPRAPCNDRYMWYAIRTWSAVCSAVPLSQFGEGARPHFCMDEWNRPTPIRRRLSLTEAARDKLIPTDLAPVLGTQTRSWKHPYSTPHSIYGLSTQKHGCQVRQGCPKDSAKLAQMGVWILVSLGGYLKTHLKDHIKYDQGPEIHGKVRRVSLLVGEAQLAGCLNVW